MIRRHLLAVAVCCSTVAACSSESAQRPTVSLSTEGTPRPSALPTEPTAQQITESFGEPGPAPIPTGPPVPFEVDGRPLPTAVVSTYRSGGGQLVQNVVAFEVLDLREIPFPSAMGVVVTDAMVHVTAERPGVVSRDEGLGWLFVDDRTLGELLDGLAGAAGLATTGWRHETVTSAVSGADCMETTYSNDSTAVVWTLSGCAYPEFSGLRAVQVRRTGTYVDAGATLGSASGAIEGYFAPVVSVALEAGLTVDGWTLDLTQPDSTGATTTVTFHLGGDESSVAQLRASLPGWTQVPANEDHGVRFQLGDDEWEVTADGVVFTHRGRFPE